MEKRDSNSNEKVIKDEIVFLNQDSNIRVALPLNDIGTIELYFYNYPKILLSLEDAEILSYVLTVAIQELTRKDLDRLGDTC